jgi:hypothetical protein
MGEKSVGTCMAGSSSKSPTSLERYCLLNQNTKTTALEPMTPGMGCSPPKCVISVGDSYVTDENGKFRFSITDPKSNQGGTGGSYTVTGPDVNRDYKITWSNSNLGSKTWPRQTYFYIPVTYVAGPTSNPTVSFNSGYGDPVFKSKLQLVPGLNKYSVYIYTRYGGSDDGKGNFNIIINCHDNP